MSSPAAITFLFHGDDEPGLREKFSEFVAELSSGPMGDLNTSRLDADSLSLGELGEAVKALPFMGDQRVVIVHNLSDANSGKALLEGLPDLLDSMPDSTRLLLIETGLGPGRTGDSASEQKRRTARRQALKKLINIVENDSRGRVLSFDMPGDSAAWIRARAARHGAQIDAEAARLLAERINEDLTLADTELSKLAAYTNGARPIKREDVALLTPYAPEANIFNMVDALGRRDGPTALRLLHQLLEDGDEPLRIFGMIQRQYRLLLLMREQIDSGARPDSAAEALGLKPFVARKMAEQARLYGSITQIERIYRFLLDTDRRMKTGQSDPALALDELVARLGAAPR